MKNCPNCKEEVPKEFDVCWSCNYDFINENILEIETAKDFKSPDGRAIRKINCLRCETPMAFQRTREFYEGRSHSIVTDLFAYKTTLDFYVCPKCSKVEMFLP